ncbi:MAG TPA: alpha/beta fold hydrolase [Candidatus Saccharimonadales bacterium]|nr:alpha/beta fold hydrolase [Candidatus Saccharimonadales bacterium]
MTPDDYTTQETNIEVGDGHRLYVQDWCNKGARVPVLSLHGGPGTPCSDSHKDYFDGSRQRAIFFDQRGTGRSTPYGSLENNTTQHLVEDITKILDSLKIDKVVLMGGSWGSCLALTFAITHPERVDGLVLYGVLTGRQEEMDWLNQAGYRTFYPEVWQAYLAKTPVENHADPTAYHFERILGSDETASKASGYAYNALDSAVMKLDDRFKPGPFEDFDPVPTRIQAHYFTNSHFLPDDHIMNNAHALTMPVYMVQGRYDMVCPPSTAYNLARKLPKAELFWATSGHAPERESTSVLRSILLELSKG